MCIDFTLAHPARVTGLVLVGAVVGGFDYTEQHATATFDLAEKLVRTRDVKEALELQGEYMRNQMSALQSQAKEFATLSESIKADLNKAQDKA